MEHDPKNDRPYHDTILILFYAINRADQMQAVADFVIATACPANHNTIIDGWHKTLNRLGFTDDTFGVIAAVMAKKAAVEQKAVLSKLSARTIDSGIPYAASLVAMGMIHIYQVCEAAFGEMAELFLMEDALAIKAWLTENSLDFGMVFQPEIKVKLPTRCPL